MKQGQIFILTTYCLIILIACGSLTSKEIGRIKIDKISDQESPDWKSTSLDLVKGDKLWFWTDINVEFKGDLQLEYQIQLIRDTDTLGFLRLHPLEKNLTIGELKTTLLDETKWSFMGSMDFLQIKETGKYTFRTILVSNQKETLKLNKADLVLKK